jgi:ATP-dependent DNA helicase RecQ
MKSKPVAEQEIDKQLINETVSFAENSSCRRKFLLHYFGENFEEKNCNGMCDNCRNPKQKLDGSTDICLLIDSVLELKGI